MSTPALRLAALMKGRFLRGGHQQSSDHNDHEQYAIGDRHNLQQHRQNKFFSQFVDLSHLCLDQQLSLDQDHNCDVSQHSRQFQKRPLQECQ